MSGSNEEEEEDEENEENEDEDEDKSDEDDDDEDKSDDDDDDEDKSDDEDDDDEKKEPDPPKISKYQKLLNTLRDINFDLDNVDREVDRVYTKVQTSRSKFREEPRPRRNYHDPMDREEIKRSFSPRRNGSNRRDDYDSDYQRRQDEDEEFNDRDYRGGRDRD